MTRFGLPEFIVLALGVNACTPGWEFDMVMTADGQACAVWETANIDVFTATFTP